MARPLVYYYDEQLTKRVPVNSEGSAILDWGEVIPGQKKEQVLWAKNESRDRAVLRQPYTGDEDLKITDYPANLMGNESAKVKLTFEPHKERIDGHHSEWGFDVSIG